MSDANAEDFYLGEKFDFVTLVQVIEHVSNPGLVLDNIREHLFDEGILIMSTTSPFGAYSIKRYELGGGESITHVLYFSPTYFRRLAERCGLKEREITYLHNEVWDSESLKGKLFLSLSK